MWVSGKGDPEPVAAPDEEAGMSGKESVLPLPGPNILVLSEEKTILTM
jgi:hypothetical protein